MKLAIVGSWAGHAHLILNSLPSLPEIQLVAAARFGPQDPLTVITRHPAAPASLKIYDDYRRMLDEVRPDVVGVFMPLYRNAEVSIQAACLGCHIASDKPLATTLEDLAALRQAVSENKVHIVAMLNMRGLPAFQSVRQAVEAGRIGEPILAYGQKSYPFAVRDEFYKTRQFYGGSIPWQAIHALDFVSYCCGKDYARVAAMQSTKCHPTHPGMEDNGALILELVGGGHAIVSFDYLRPWSDGVRRSWGGDKLRLVGSEATIETFDDLTRVELMTPTATENIPLAPPRSVFAEFVSYINGADRCLITPQESLRLTEVALRARDSADTGTVVQLI